MPHIRLASVSDAGALIAIYGPYVTDSCISFEYDPPSEEEFAARIRSFSAFYPYLVWEEPDGRILGYAYAHRHAERAAYQWNAELSVYLHPEATHRGIGTALYRALLAILREQGLQMAYACITCPNKPSEALHRAMGFQPAGVWRNAGYKQGRWRDVAWFQKPLQEACENPAPPKSVHEIPPQTLSAIFARAEAADESGDPQ